MAGATSRTAASSRPTSTPTIRCGLPRCRRSNRSSCRAAGSGAASASRPFVSRRRRCSTPTSRRRASVSARCRCAIRTSRSLEILGGGLVAAARSRMVLMDRLRLMTRRDVAGGAAASAASLVLTGLLPSLLPCPAHAQSTARIVVIGGGFGGASCARALRRIDPKLQVTLIEPNRTFVACPFSNQVIAGLREIEAQQFNYDRIGAEGVTVIAQAADKVDAQKRMVDLADGT